mgnify:CR=1 FL=1
MVNIFTKHQDEKTMRTKFKTITLSLPEELYDEMQKLSDVNWSAVAKIGIKHYIALRKTTKNMELKCDFK